MCLCVCVSVCEHISGTPGPILTKFFVHIPCDRGSVLLWRRCATLCTSGFMDDIKFGRNGLYVVAWPASWVATSRQLRARPGQSLMSVNTCCICVMSTSVLNCTQVTVMSQTTMILTRTPAVLSDISLLLSSSNWRPSAQRELLLEFDFHCTIMLCVVML